MQTRFHFDLKWRVLLQLLESAITPAILSSSVTKIQVTSFYCISQIGVTGFLQSFWQYFWPPDSDISFTNQIFRFFEIMGRKAEGPSARNWAPRLLVVLKRVQSWVVPLKFDHAVWPSQAPRAQSVVFFFTHGGNFFAANNCLEGKRGNNPLEELIFNPWYP